MPIAEPSRGRARIWRGLWRLLWRQPLFAIPFALFFTLLEGGAWRSVGGYYLVSLIFAYSISTAIWVTECFIAPRVLRGGPALLKGGLPQHALLYVGSSVFGAYLGALLVRLTLIHDFLGSARSVLVMTVFTLMFTVLVTGIVYAWHFYHAALSRARAEEEMNLARRIQRGFLMTAFPRRPRLEVHAVNVSSREVSGDFYDVVPAGEDAYLIAIADVSGKGVPAALLSSMLQASLRTQAGVVGSTAAIMGNLNRLVCESTSRQQFATFFLALVDERTLTLTYTNAGHNPPLLLRPGAPPRMLATGGTVVGMLDFVVFEQEQLVLAPGDRVIAYTDGLSEARRPDGEMFGDDRVADVAATLDGDLSAEAACEHLLAELRGWLAGREAGDDVTVLAIRVIDPVAAAPPSA